MIGINVDKVNSTIRKIDSFSEMVETDIKSITENIGELNNFYSGNDINFLFQNIIDEMNSIKKITSVISNYSDVLSDVVEAYKSQEINVKNKYDIVTNKTNI